MEHCHTGRRPSGDSTCWTGSSVTSQVKLSLLCDIWGSHSEVSEDSLLPCCDAVMLDMFPRFQWGLLGWGSCWSSGHWTWMHCDSSECWKLHAQWQTQHISQKNWISAYSWSLAVLTWFSLGMLGLLKIVTCTIVFYVIMLPVTKFM